MVWKIEHRWNVHFHMKPLTARLTGDEEEKHMSGIDVRAQIWMEFCIPGSTILIVPQWLPISKG
jgi:hypothetical protein